MKKANIPFEELSLRQLPIDRPLKGLTTGHPLYKRFEQYKKLIEEARQLGNAEAATIYHTAALELAQYEN